jgi:phospholipase D1/2
LIHQPITSPKASRNTYAWRLAVLLGLLALAALWHWSVLNGWLDVQALAAWERSVQTHPLAPLIIVAAYVLGSVVLFPVTVLTAVTIVTFGPVTGNVYGLAGWLVSASLGFCVGRHVRLDWLRSLLGERFERLRCGAERKGLLAVLALRLVPVAPFSIVNLFIGASGIRFADFILGSMLGRIPGILAFTLFAVQLRTLAHSISLGKFILVIAGLTLVFLGQRWMTRQLVAASAPLEPKL